MRIYFMIMVWEKIQPWEFPFFVFLYIYYDGVDLNLLIYLLISVQLNTMIVVLLNLLSTFSSFDMVIS